MPFRPAWSSGRVVGGKYSGASSGAAAAQPYGRDAPRAATPAKATQLLTSGKVVGRETGWALSTQSTQGNAYNLPTVHDIVGLQFKLDESSVTGSGSVTLDYANIIDHIVVRDRNGNAFDTIQFKDPTAAGLHPAIYDWQTLTRPTIPTSVGSNTVAASTAISGTLATLTVYGLRCAAEDGPWSVETWYNTIAGFGGTGVTALSVNNEIRAMFGDVTGPDGKRYNTKYAYQNIPSTGAGDFHLETTGIIKNTYINHMLLQNVSTLTYLDHMVVNSHGQNIDTNLAEATIVQAMNDIYYGAFGAKTLCPTAGPPAINTQFTIGDSDELVLNMGTSVSNLQVAYQYLLPSGSAT